MRIVLSAGSLARYPLRLLRFSETAFGVILAVSVGAAASLGALVIFCLLSALPALQRYLGEGE